MIKPKLNNSEKDLAKALNMAFNKLLCFFGISKSFISHCIGLGYNNNHQHQLIICFFWGLDKLPRLSSDPYLLYCNSTAVYLSNVPSITFVLRRGWSGWVEIAFAERRRYHVTPLNCIKPYHSVTLSELSLVYCGRADRLESTQKMI